MFDLLTMELGVACLAFWALSLVVLWFTVDRRTRPGPIRNVIVIEFMMLISITSLLLGVSLCISGYGALG